ncbi:MAG: NADPH-dependent 7-cyano-7-deazaguanine reductase QueF [Legionella longbeachae]|nr:NADPH-dependent 7-cyano-7-deazaguanine reductase QueF [Legionella longbeachae]
MKFYKIKELSKLTSTTVRMIQFYDEIDLLKPTKRSNAGYRLYSEEDLVCLQQIITLKYLGLSLTDIKNIVKAPEFDVLKSLHIQAQVLSDNAIKIQEAAKLLKYIAAQIEAGQIINWESTSIITKILEMNTMNDTVLQKYQSQAVGSELGKKTEYDQSYNPERLYPIPRAGKRKEIGVDPNKLPFLGFDCWNHYEVSWLNDKGKPIVAMAEIYYDCASPFIIESKSLKLYFNSFNNSTFKTIIDVEKTIQKDLEQAIDSPVTVIINQLGHSNIGSVYEKFEGECIDDLDVTCTKYSVEPSYLTTSDDLVNEILYSDLLKSNCLVTNQPDWGSVQIIYTGNKINREGLLQYLVSFRNHNEFHEQCIERIFVDIMNYCKPSELTIYGRYTRRGGLDINPYRSTKNVDFKNLNYRLIRQ